MSIRKDDRSASKIYEGWAINRVHFLRFYDLLKPINLIEESGLIKTQ